MHRRRPRTVPRRRVSSPAGSRPGACSYPGTRRPARVRSVRPDGPPPTAPASAGASTAAGRRSRAVAAPAWLARRRGTAA